MNFDEYLKKKGVMKENKLPYFKWVNIVGSVKTGKTTYATHLPFKALYIDTEEGTRAVNGNFIRINNIDDYNTLKAALTSFNPNVDIIVLDTMDKFEKIITENYLNEKGIMYIGDLSYGKGYYEVAQIFKKEIMFLMSKCKVLVTITHSSVVSNFDTTPVSKEKKMNLSKKVNDFVQGEADAHIEFKRAINSEKKNYLDVSIGKYKQNEESFEGARDKRFYTIKTTDDLTALIKDNIDTMDKKTQEEW